jgi:hypothetical protein
MPHKVDVSLLTPIDKTLGDSATDTRLLRRMATEAQKYMLSFRWCKRIRRGWFGWGVGGVCAVFLFEIVPESRKVDSKLWVIVGDLPPAYLVLDKSPTPMSALKNYVDLMQQWVEAARAGKSVDDCIPVNVAPTKPNATLLKRRLAFLRTRILA